MNSEPIQHHDAVNGGSFQIQAQERVLFGRPVATVLPEEIVRLNAKRVFVTSSQSLARLSNGPLQWVEKALGAAHAGTFSSIRAHSPREDVIAGAAAARAAGADLLLAVGGGSTIDATKAMLMCFWMGLTDPAAMEPYRNGLAPAARRPIKSGADPIRLITVSTTLSASEFNPSAGVTESRSRAKQSYRHRLLVPRSVILDPAATLDTPDWLLYSTGIRAVDHAVESYCSPLANPATEVLSLQGLRLLARALPAIKADPSDLQARSDAQIGMWQAIAGSVAGAGTGASHGIGYALGAGYNIPHGHTSCVMLPAVMRWNEPVQPERHHALAEVLNRAANRTTSQVQRAAWESVAALIAALGQPGNLRAVGIQRDDLQAISLRALDYPNVLANPRKISNAEQVRQILEMAW